MSRILSLFYAGVAVFACAAVSGQVTVNGLFGDGAVLQRDISLIVWGRAPAGTEVTVRLADQVGVAKAGADDAWRVKLPAMPAGGPFDMSVAGGTNKHIFKGIMVGEVWFCGGGAGMSATAGSDKELVALAAKPIPGIRLVQVPGQIAGMPAPGFSSRPRWIAAAMDQGVASMSAVGLRFAVELQKRIGGETTVPVGIIQATAANSLTESWVSRPALLSAPETRGIVEAFDTAVAQYLEASRNYSCLFRQWTAAMEVAEASGAPYPQAPPLPPEPRSNPRKPCGYFNGAIAVAAPYGIRGVLWSHGELDVSKPDLHRHVFPAMIKSWRAAWEAPALPFIFTQVGASGARPGEPREMEWALFRAAQEAGSRLPHAAMVKTADIEGAPPAAIARRMAEAAMRIACGGE